jgi:hypothetical protein
MKDGKFLDQFSVCQLPEKEAAAGIRLCHVRVRSFKEDNFEFLYVKLKMLCEK